ncbi:hypothetical protein JCM10914A_06800 [Paenibacillus sp. JCM 10914]|uniref:hypothetical protein n=1 Tax=Paenibacillus sp. JCM 10914 TaxID=1236974 RepID=UPI0003CC335D|nr:hypothetical protein [Paenibacillus sp. JCM 10914]GAE05816.1 hypothetical protein JCM10914_1940 [Paenibacillus sp. JCM 10914]
MNTIPVTNDNGFLFNVDILVKSSSNALALQYLLEMLNDKAEVIDFRVKSGMELGEIINTLIQAKKKSVINKASQKMSASLKEKAAPLPAVLQTEEKKHVNNTITAGNDPFEWIKLYSQDNRLVRLTTNRHGKQTSLPCRILNYDENNFLVNVYHVDEKQVYTFRLNEIDEFSVS